MSAWGKEIDEALARTSGAAWKRVALQVNPAGYMAKYRGQDHGLAEDQYNGELIAKCVELGIDAIAVTDHNTVAGVAAIQAAAKQAGVCVFPGFEIYAHEGVHLLAVFGPAFDLARLAVVIGTVKGVSDPDVRKSRHTIDWIAAEIAREGGLTIAAHADEANGLLTEIDGDTRIEAWTSPHVHAIAIKPHEPGDIDNEAHRNIALNRDVAHKRQHSHAFVNARDVEKPETLAKPNASCWIKMDGCSLEGLRQSFVDPENRVRRGARPDEDRSRIVAMHWTGGFLDGVALRFNEGLNTLIGGRGAGKSTVLESIRFALDVAPLGAEAKLAHEGVVRGILKPGTTVRVLVRTTHPLPAEYLIERVTGRSPVVRDATGAVTSLRPVDVIGRIDFFGQHEIGEVARSSEQQLALVRRFVSADGDARRALDSARTALERSREEIVRLGDERDRLAKTLEPLAGYEETLKRYEATGLESRLGDRTAVSREEVIVERVSDTLASLSATLRDARGALPVDRTFLTTAALGGLPSAAVLGRFDAILTNLVTHASASLDAAEATVEQARAAAAAVRTDWDVARTRIETEYQATLRALQREKVNAQEFVQLRGDVERLRPVQQRLANVELQLQQLRAGRATLVNEYQTCQSTMHTRIERAVRKVSGQLRDRVAVRAEFHGNTAPFEKFVREKVGGRMNETLTRFKTRPDRFVDELAAAARLGANALVAKFNVPLQQAQSLAALSEATLMELEEVELDPAIAIELNVAPSGSTPEYRPLDALSTGQRATALLLLLLLDDNAPLVIDQPEDDLDNRFVSEEVVGLVRDQRARRQMVFATHNANIPVLGDAELVIGMSTRECNGAAAGQIRDEDVGSIDRPSVERMMEVVLEGGREAFERRRQKYGIT